MPLLKYTRLSLKDCSPYSNSSLWSVFPSEQSYYGWAATLPPTLPPTLLKMSFGKERGHVFMLRIILVARKYGYFAPFRAMTFPISNLIQAPESKHKGIQWIVKCLDHSCILIDTPTNVYHKERAKKKKRRNLADDRCCNFPTPSREGDGEIFGRRPFLRSFCDPFLCEWWEVRGSQASRARVGRKGHGSTDYEHTMVKKGVIMSQPVDDMQVAN